MAELRLGVSFDLVYFRQQLAKLGRIAASEFTAPIKIKLNRQVVDRELNNLQRLFARREYTIKIGDSQVEAASGRIDALQRRVDGLKASLQEKIVVKIKYEEEGKPSGRAGVAVSRGVKSTVGSQSLIADANYKELQALYRFAKEAQIPFEDLKRGAASSAAELRRVLAPAFQSVGDDVKKGIAAGLADADSQLAKLGKAMGESLLKATKTVLGIASPSREFKEIGKNVGEGFEQGAIGAMDKAFDALEAKIKERLQKLQQMMQPQASRRGAFPFVAKSGPIESSVLLAESAALAKQIDEARAQIAQIQQRRQGRLAAEQGALAGVAGRMLPAGRSNVPTASAQEIVVGNFYRSMQNTERMLQTYFSANSYLPKSSQQLGDAMRQAAASIKALPGGKGAIAALPSSEMLRPIMERRKFQAAMRRAVEVDMQNAIRQQMQGLMLPAAGQTSYVSPEQKRLQQEQARFQAAMAKAAAIDAENAAAAIAKETRAQRREFIRQVKESTRRLSLPAAGQTRAGAQLRQGLAGQVFRAPSITDRGGGQLAVENAMAQSGPIADRLRTAAVAFAKNAPAVLKYLNLFGTAGGINISDLPKAGETPGRYIRRIQQSLQQTLQGGGFGPATVPSRQFFQFGSGPQLPGRPLQLALPAAGMTTAAGRPGYGYDRVRGIGGGAAAGGGGGAIVPYKAPPADFSGARNLLRFRDALQGSMGYLQTRRLPLTGAINELGEEFGTAVKQVLLFGTAYKALAFVTDLPRQAFEAAKGLQTFKNQLSAVTSESNTFEQSLQFIDNLATRFNVPLESARNGFTRMYASMQPAGFNQQEIENLFTGIAKAAATFGMSTDEVNRVTNALSQMASKGQLSAEEVKNQLGDVLPGALSIFAEAAQMDIGEFLDAMEKGAFRADAMREVLNNVGVTLNNKFGPSAQNAAKTLQGALTSIQNSLLLMYEAFAPIVSELAAVFGPQITSLIKDVTNVAKVLANDFSDAEGAVSTLTPRAKALYDIIQQLTPSFREAGSALVQLGNFFVQLVPVAVQLGNVLLQIASSNVGKAFIVLSISAGILQGAFVALARVGIAQAIAAIYKFIGTQLGSVLTQWRLKMNLATKGMIGMTNAARASRLAVIALKTAMTGLIVGVSLLAIEAIGTALLSIGDKARQSAAEVRQLKADLDTMAGAGDTLAVAAELETAKAQEAAALTRLNKAHRAAQLLSTVGAGERSAAQQELKDAQAAYDVAQAKRVGAEKALQIAERVRQQQQEATQKAIPVTPLPEEGKGTKGSKAERESQVPILQLRLELARKLFAIDTQIASARLADNTVLISELELTRKLTELEYDRRQILLEDIPDEEKRLKIAEQQFQRQQAILENRLKLQLDLNSELLRSERAIAGIVVSQREETDYVKRYYQMVLNGVNPALAKTRIEVAKRFAEEAKSLETQMDQLELGMSTLQLTIDELAAKKSLNDVEKEQLDNARKNLEVLREQLRLRGIRKEELPRAMEETVAQARAAEGPRPFGVTIAEGYDDAKTKLNELGDSANMIVNAANSIGDAFGKAFTDIATGAENWRQGLATAFQSVASMFADMVAQMLAKWAAMQIMGMFLPGPKAGATQPGLTAGIQQYPLVGSANGNVLRGGFQAFANGGVVTGPTLGLIGEGRFNEAVVPLPDGRKIPVDLGGAAGSNISTNIVVNMNNGQASSQMTGSGGQALGRELEGAVRNVILKESRPGGLIYSNR